MNGDVEGVASRPRPLSGGLWTLFSWLRRDERASSNESLSSVGSDRTAASFAFLAPAHYSVNNSPVFLPPPSPPTDSYKKRVQERDVRRQHERNLTLHRKYGLYRSDGSAGYDAFSLPPARKLEGNLSCKWDRDRRATSECCQRRALHVPGKRRAPLPPILASLESPVTHSRGPRKRRAPQPPIKLHKENEEAKVETNITIHMNSPINREETVKNCSAAATNTSEKCRKKESGSKDAKTRPEKSFLKNIFENRKRNSAIDTSAVKILPSISELDKQATNMIENEKFRALKHNLNESDIQHRQTTLDNSNNKTKVDSWFCIKCLRKYDSSVSECPYCIFEKVNNHLDILKTGNTKDAKTNASDIQTQTDSRVISQILSSKYKNEEKQKLKEMLKEMKDSLPKRSKHEHKELITTPKNNSFDSIYGQKDSVSETPTLRIGASINSNNTSSISKPSTSGITKNFNVSKSTTPLESFQNVVTTQPVVINHETKHDTGERNCQNSTSKQNNLNINGTPGNIFKRISSSVNDQKIENNLLNAANENKSLQTPLRISSLLNPVYIPKNEHPKPVTTQIMLHTEFKKSENNVDQFEPKPVSLILTKQDSTVSNKTKNPSSKTSFQTDVKKVDRITIIDKNKEISTNNNDIQRENSALLINDNIIAKNTKDTIKLTNLTNDTSNEAIPSTSTGVTENYSKNKVFNKDGLNQHIKRRELINQLEKSIANGDEHAAAEAAIKLAQLRLSCSVLSFSSQIISEPSSSSTVKTETPDALELSNKEKTKEATNISANDNVLINNKGLLPRTNSVFTPIASSSQEKSVQQNEIKMSHSSENAKSVPPVGKKASEILNFPTINNQKVTQNSASIEISTDKENTDVLISVWVEDKEATRGPIKLKTQRHANVGELRRQAQTALGLPSHLQRWIVGRTLCTDDTTPLVTVAGPEFNAPFYLCLVETEQQPAAGTSKQVKEETTNLNNKNDHNVYKELMELEQQALVHNAEVFECGVCIEECKPGNGVILRECVHMFCKDCLADVVRHSGEPDISCPAMGCRGILQEREIRGLVTPDDYERWLARGLAAAESGTRNAFHCRTKDCTGWALCDPGVRRFLCPVCKHSNCVPCQAIHEGETCEKYRARLQAVSDQNSSQSDDSTRALLNNMINKGEALECPDCKAIITKMWGCDWVKCSACKTEICWVTRGRRWGPGGRGDTSAGCRCGVDGKRCHPSCGYCH